MLNGTDFNCSWNSNSNCTNSNNNDDDEDNKEWIMNHVIDTIGRINPLQTMQTIMVNQFSPLMLINELTCAPLLSRKNSNDYNSNINLSRRSNRVD